MIPPRDTLPGTRYFTEPLVVPVVSGYLPEEARGRRGIFAPSAPTAREERVPVPMREIVCYECGKSSQIPVAALSAHCVHCRTHLTTADVELKPGSRRLTIRTLGDVNIPAHVSLSQLNIVCRNLIISGKAAGFMRCTGELELKGQAEVSGQVHAGSLMVAAGAQATGRAAISADHAQIEGQLTGQLNCREDVYIGPAGLLIGDCRAVHIDFGIGGRHDGAWIRAID